MKQYLLSVIAYILIFFSITGYTYRDDRPADGPLSLGFPFPFYHGGGFCREPCGPYFYWHFLLLDVLFLILPIIGVYWYLKKKKSIT